MVLHWLNAMNRRQDVVEVGDVAPGLDLPGLEGGRVRVPDPDGRAVLLSFLRHAG